MITITMPNWIVIAFVIWIALEVVIRSMNTYIRFLEHQITKLREGRK